MAYTIRLAREDDAKAINDIAKYLGYLPLTDDEVKETLVHLLQSSNDEIYVAESQEGVIGWLHLFYARRLTCPDFYEIGGLVVDPEYRGQGVGRRLVEQVTSKYQGKIRVRCNDVRLESHKFYEALEFGTKKVQRVFDKCS